MSISSSEYRVQSPDKVNERLTRTSVYTKNQMMAILDFIGGAWSEPEPLHSHPHEQIAYIAEGEIIFYCEGRDNMYLRAGDT